MYTINKTENKHLAEKARKTNHVSLSMLTKQEKSRAIGKGIFILQTDFIEYIISIFLICNFFYNI